MWPSKIEQALGLYRHQPRLARLFLRGRVLLSDLELVERQVPQTGEIIDLGCGHGLFASLLALGSPRRRVRGIDLDESRIRLAQAAAGSLPNISFVCADIRSTGLPAADAVTIVDVLYLMPFEQQMDVLLAVKEKLRPGGLLVLKAQERRPRWKYAFTYAQEFLATSLGLTQGGSRRFYFPDRQEALAMLRRAGFKPEIIEMPTRRPYTDILYLGRT